MKRFYKTTALLVSLLGISNISCGELGGAIAIHETEEIGQAILHPIERVGELWKNGKDSFKEHLVEWIIGAVVVGREVFSLYRWWSAVPVFTEGDITQFFTLTGRRDYGPAWKFISKSKKKDAKDANGETLLHKAVSIGDIGAILVLLAAGANKDARDNVGRTPLHGAAFRGHAGVVEILLAAGANKDARDKYGYTSLHWAASEGRIGVVQVLLKAGADKEAKTQEGITPLHLAAWGREHTEAVKVLVDAGASGDIRDKDGCTPLHFAAYWGHPEVAKVLLAAGANKTLQNTDGYTPLHYAPSEELKRLLA